MGASYASGKAVHQDAKVLLPGIIAQPPKIPKQPATGVAELLAAVPRAGIGDPFQESEEHIQVQINTLETQQGLIKATVENRTDQ
jgi:hypothetical protein